MTQSSAPHTYITGRVHSRAQPVRHAERREVLHKQTMQRRKKGSFSAAKGGRGAG